MLLLGIGARRPDRLGGVGQRLGGARRQRHGAEVTGQADDGRAFIFGLRR